MLEIFKNKDIKHKKNLDKYKFFIIFTKIWGKIFNKILLNIIKKLKISPISYKKKKFISNIYWIWRS